MLALFLFAGAGSPTSSGSRIAGDDMQVTGASRTNAAVRFIANAGAARIDAYTLTNLRLRLSNADTTWNVEVVSVTGLSIPLISQGVLPGCSGGAGEARA